MKNLKRLFAFGMSVMILLIGIMPIYAAETTETTGKSNEALFMEYLDIISDKADSLYGQTVSRGDFAEYLAKMLKLNADSNYDENGRYFIDVTGYDYAEPSINALVDANIISVDSERHFRPADAISMDEAVKMVVSALGYRPKAEAWGGYPTGYNRVAKQQGITDNISDGNFTLNDAAQLLFNALITPIYAIDSISTNSEGGLNYTYTDEEGVTLLETLYLLRYTKDVLTGADGIDIQREEESSNDRVVIGTTPYTTDNPAQYKEFIGHEVYGIFESKTDKIVYMFSTRNGNEKITEIDIADFISYTKDEIKYYKGSRKTTVSITGAVLLYNGAPIKRNSEQLMNGLVDGKIRIIDYNGDGKFDAVMTENYTSFRLKYFDGQNNMIFAKDNTTSFELNKYEYVSIKDSEGNFIEMSEVVPNSVLNIAATQDGERIEVIVSGESVEGKIKEVRNTANKLNYQIDERIFEVSSQYKSVLENVVKAGDNVKVYTNMFGKIISAEVNETEGYKVAYLMNAAITSGGLSDVAKLYIYTSGGELLTVECAESIVVDGVKYRDGVLAALGAIPTAVVNGDSIKITPQIIRYKQNDKGKIDKIDTYNLGEETVENSLVRTLEPIADTMKFNGRIGKNQVLSADTKVYHVPFDEEVMTAEAEDFNISSQNSINNRYSFKLECYKLRGENEYVDVVVFRRKPTDTEQNDWWNSNMFLVKNIEKAIDEESDEYYLINGYMGGGENSISVYEDDLYKIGNVALAEIKEGDLIRFRKNFKGRVHDIELLYRPNDFDFSNWKNYNEQSSLFDPVYDQYFQLSFGYVSEVTEHNVGWGYKSGTQTDEMIDMSSTTVMFYDSGARNGQKVYTDRASTLRDFKSFDDECDKIIVQLKNGNIYSVVAYR